MNSISLCMMIKDEAETLEKALRQVYFLVDEIILGMDENSSDPSRKIAEAFNAKIIPFSFKGDFSSIRNKLMKECTKDWIFILDGHEYLYGKEDALPDTELLTKMFKKVNDYEKERGLEVLSISIPLIMSREEGGGIGYQTRFIKKDKGLRYEGAVHNKLRGLNLL